MHAATLWMFALVAAVAIATPGPTVLLALSNGSRYGVRGALPGMLGAVAADFVLVGTVALGLGALLAASETVFTAMRWIGAAYLAWLGLKLLRSRGELELSQTDGDASSSASRLFAKSFLVAATNPKYYLFFSALLPQFIDAAAPQGPQYLAIALIIAGIDAAVMLGYALLGARAIRILQRRALVWLDRCCGGVLIALAASLLFYRRS